VASRFGITGACCAVLLLACGSSLADKSKPQQTDIASAQASNENDGSSPGSGARSTGGGENNQGSEPVNLGASEASSPWCSALSVIQKDCQDCHGKEQKFGAPMPLVDFDDFEAPAVSDKTEKVFQRVQSRIHDAQKPMPPSGMATGDLAVLDAWLQGGASAGADPTCGGSVDAPRAITAASDDFQWPPDCEQFYTLTTSSKTSPGDKYVVGAGSEEHPQFVFDAPWGTDNVQLLAYRPIADNTKVLHHWILYQNDASGLFGGGLGGGKFLVGWAPGSQGNTAGMPEDVGMYMPGGTQSLRLDVHYYNLSGTEPEPDASGLEMCVTHKLRPNTATVIGLTGNATAPVGHSDNVTSCTAAVTGTAPVHFLSVSPHMHKLGVHAKLELTRAGTKSALHDAPFDFLDQKIYDLGDLPIQNNDVLSTTCSYDNDTGHTVKFGQNSDDEMCFNFVTYFPMGALRCGLAL